MKQFATMLCILVFLFATNVFGQLSGTKAIPGDYASLAAAITDLNTQGVGAGGVTFNVAAGHTETTPATGYAITATGTVANQIVLQKSGAGTNPTFTASPGLTVGAINDGIITIIGGDYITIDGFTLLENPANTVTAAGTNTMTEFGVALFYATTTNGSQNNTVKNCTITLNRTYQNTFGIYCNVRHSATSMTTAADITDPAGASNNLKLYGNAISNVNTGVCVIGSLVGANMTTGLDIGGAGAPTGNTISDFGTTATFSGYVSVSASVNGILVNNQQNFNIAYNSITSSVGGVTAAATLRGIYVQATGTLPVSGTFTRAITNNSISVKGGAAANVLQGIAAEGGNLTISQTINANDFHDFDHTVSGTGAITFILATNAVQNSTINNNTFTNMTVNTAGGVVFINKSVLHPASAVLNINNNSIVTGFSKTGAGGTVQFYESFSVSPSTVTETNSGNNFSNVTLTGATILTAWRTADGPASAPFGPSKTVTNNTFSNITFGTSTSTILTVGYSNTGATNNVSGNVISNVNGGGAITAITSPTASQNFFSNTITGVSSTAAGAVTGLSFTGGTAQNVYKNKIYNLTVNNAAGTVNGILISTVPTTVNVYNNLIDSLNAPITSNVDGVRGISITGATSSTTLNVYYNTVYLNSSSTGTDFGSTGLYHTTSATATSGSLNLRNNIIVNASTPNGTGLAVAYRRSSTALANYASTSNNNLFYSGTADASHLIFYDGTNSDQTIGAYKARVSPRDASSATENPPFLSISGGSSNFLHINTTIPTQIEGGAASIGGITDDYDGDTRNASTPDIGADEFAGIILDLNPPAISYSALGNVASTSNRSFTSVTITDATGVNTTAGTRPRVYYKRTTDANTFNDNTSGTAGWKFAQANGAGGTPFDFTINYALLSGGAGVAVNDTVQYFVVAQDVTLAVNVGINSGTFAAAPTSVALTSGAFPLTGTINSYRILPSISGTFSVGVSAMSPVADYATITLAVAALNGAVITGPVTFNLIDVSYPSETFPITINDNGGSSGANTVTIKPASGVTTTVSGSSTSSIFKLNGADYIILDGSNNGTNSRDMTISNTSTSSSTAVMQLTSLGTGLGATNNEIKNCVIRGGGKTTGIYGISAGSTVGASGDDNDNLTIQNNLIVKAYYGIYAVASSAGVNNNLSIQSNTIGSSAVGDSIGFNGMTVTGATAATVNQNEVLNILQTASFDGIIVGTNVTNSTFSRNLIHGLTNNGTNRAAAFNVASVASANLTFVNNVIYGVINNGTAGNSFGCYGFYVTAGGGYNIYFNSINMSGDRDAVATTKPTSISSGVFMSAGTVLDIRNNVIVNTQIAATNAPKSYAIYSGVANTAFTSINRNDYYTTGAQGVLGFLGADQATLGAWQTATAQDANSISGDPLFVSSTDLRPYVTSPLLLAGVTIPGVSNDYLGVSRGGTPTIGAYENSVASAMTYSNSATTQVTGNVLTNTTSQAIIRIDVVTTGISSPLNVSSFSVSASGTTLISDITNARIYSTGASSVFSTSNLIGGPVSPTIAPFAIPIGSTPSLLSGTNYFWLTYDIPSGATVNNLVDATCEGVVVSAITRVPTPTAPPGNRVIKSALAAGDYTIGSPLFEQIAGRHFTFEKSTRTVLRPVAVEQQRADQAKDPARSSEPTASSSLSTTTRMMEVQEEYWTMMDGGKPYQGPKSLPVTAADRVKYGLGDNVLSVYARIIDALSDLNSLGVAGAVRFLLNDPTYPSETYPLTINVTATAVPTAVNTVTFKPNTGVTTTVAGSMASGTVFNIVNTNYVTIDGSNALAGTSRNWTIQNTSATSPTVINIGSLGTTPITNTTVKNCVVINGGQGATAIVVGSGTTIGDSGVFRNTTIQNNDIRNAYMGVYIKGGTAVQQGKYVNVLSNTLNTANSIAYVGVYLQGIDTATIQGNDIGNFDAAGAQDDNGVWLAAGSKNITVTANQIHDLGYTGASGYGGHGITVSTGLTGVGIQLLNNVIFHMYGDGDAYTTTPGDNPIGMYLFSTQDGIKIYHNSINLYGNTLNRTGALSMGIALGTGTTVDLRDNSIVNNLGLLAATGTGSVGVAVQTANTQLSSVDFNDYYVNPSGSGLKAVGQIAAAVSTTLTDWRTATGQDLSSVSGDPLYVANTDLRPYSGSPLLLAGVTLPEVPFDYLGVPRGGSPTIGAYENSVSSTMTYVLSTTAQVTGNVLTNTVDQAIIGIQVVTTGFASPLSVSSVTVSATGTTTLSDISNAKVYFTGTSSVFATGDQLGGAVAPTFTDFVISGAAKVLSTGTNYFWLTFDIAPGATVNNVVDGTCSSILVSAVPRTPSLTAPIGNRTIKAALAAGDYTIGSPLFNRILGRELRPVRSTRTVLHEVAVEQTVTSKEAVHTVPSGATRMVEVQEEYWTLMDGEKPYRGPRSLPVTDKVRQEFGLGDNVLSVYATITDALVDLNSLGVAGAVRFLLNDPSYPSETYPLSVNITTAFPTGVNTVTFKPNTGVTTTVSGSSATSIFNLNGADYITLDGSNTNGGSTRDWTLVNTNAGTTSAVVWIQTGTGPNAATNNTIKNLTVTGNSNTTTLFGIGSGGATISTTSNGTGNNDNRVENCSVSKTQYGVYSAGASVASKNTGTVITKNVINALPPNNLLIGGVFVRFEDGVQITQNTIGNIIRTNTPGAFGIALGREAVTNTLTSVVNDEVVNATVARNKIDSVTSTSTTGFTAAGIIVSATTSGTNQIANNMISRVSSPATPSDAVMGIYLGGGTGGTTQIYYNSISLVGNRGATGSSNPSYGIVVGGTTPVVDIKDNIFYNTQTTTAAGKSYAVGLAYTSTVGNYTNLTSDRNVFYTSGSSASFGRVGGLNQTAGTEIATLAAWNTETGRDGASIGGSDPLYTSATDLHITNLSSPASNAGVTVGVAVDFDGDSRSGTPDIGADEFGSSNVSVNVAYNTSWNMLSLPVDAPTSGDSIVDVFPLILNGYGFDYTGSYNIRYTMTRGAGYWGKFGSAGSSTIIGTPLPTDSLSVQNRWNMVGSISDTVPVASITSNPPLLMTSAGFFGYSGSYSLATDIIPGKGYWVKAGATGKFYLASPVLARGNARGTAKVSPAVQVLDGLNSVTITDARGASQTLYFGADANNEIQLALYDMPPTPPAGAFDARFETRAGGSMVQTHAVKGAEGVELPVMIQSSNYPLTLTWNVKNGATYQVTDGLEGRVFGSKEMTSGGSMQIANSAVTRFVVKVIGDGTLPAEFALHQNYPNPFNPTTNIKYALPVDSRVTMEIYNIIGQRVRTLIADNQAAGYHVAEWNGMNNGGQQLSSGVYFLQMSAKGANGKSFSDIKKLMLLK